MALRCARGETGAATIRGGRRTVQLTPDGGRLVCFDPRRALATARPLRRRGRRRDRPLRRPRPARPRSASGPSSPTSATPAGARTACPPERTSACGLGRDRQPQLHRAARVRRRRRRRRAARAARGHARATRRRVPVGARGRRRGRRPRQRRRAGAGPADRPARPPADRAGRPALRRRLARPRARSTCSPRACWPRVPPTSAARARWSCWRPPRSTRGSSSATTTRACRPRSATGTLVARRALGVAGLRRRPVVLAARPSTRARRSAGACARAASRRSRRRCATRRCSAAPSSTCSPARRASRPSIDLVCELPPGGPQRGARPGLPRPLARAHGGHLARPPRRLAWRLGRASRRATVAEPARTARRRRPRQASPMREARAGRPRRRDARRVSSACSSTSRAASTPDSGHHHVARARGEHVGDVEARASGAASTGRPPRAAAPGSSRPRPGCARRRP